MKIFKKVISWIEKLLGRNDKISLLNSSSIVDEKSDNEEFICSLKNHVMQKEKIEVLICEGDGLGIQSKMNY